MRVLLFAIHLLSFLLIINGCVGRDKDDRYVEGCVDGALAMVEENDVQLTILVINRAPTFCQKQKEAKSKRAEVK